MIIAVLVMYVFCSESSRLRDLLRLESCMLDDFAFKVLLRGEFEALNHDMFFWGAPNDAADGFIHMSTAAQLEGTLRKHFDGLSDVFILAIDLRSLGDRVRWEPAKNGELYPHLFGSLPLKAVVSSVPLERNSGGMVNLPLMTTHEKWMIQENNLLCYDL